MKSEQGTDERFSYQERYLVKQLEVATLETGSFFATLSEEQTRMGRLQYL